MTPSAGHVEQAPSACGLWLRCFLSAWLLLSGCGQTQTGSYISDVVPDHVFADRATQVELRGQGLYGSVSLQLDDNRGPVVYRSWNVKIGQQAINSDDVQQLDSKTLSVLVPAGLALGTYDLTVLGPGGQSYFLPRALEVQEPTAPVAENRDASSANQDVAVYLDAASGGTSGQQRPPEAGDGGVGLQCRGADCPVASLLDAAIPPVVASGGTSSLDASATSSGEAGAQSVITSQPDGGRTLDGGRAVNGGRPVNGGGSMDASGVNLELLDASTQGDSAIPSEASLDSGIVPVCAGGANCPPCAVFPPPAQLTGFGIGGALYTPTMADNNQILFFTDLSSGSSIWWAQRFNRGLVFSAANSSILNSGPTGTPQLNWNGLHLYFFSQRAGGLGGRDLWYTTRASITDYFQTPALLAGVNSSSDDHYPTVTRDELVLVFTSNRPGGQGAGDLWMTERTDTSLPFSAPRALVELNSSVNETGPALIDSGLILYFTSDRNGDNDVWVATRPNRSSPFGNPVALDGINGAGSDQDVAISPDGLELFFSSDRSGTQQLWRSLRTCR